MKSDDRKAVLSFDIGIKNLAYCFLRYHNVSSSDGKEDTRVDIMKWAIIDISCGQSKPSFDDICANLVSILKSLTTDIESFMSENDTVTVLIENQPAFKAPTMKSIQIIIYAFFKILGNKMQPRLISATVKNKYMQSKGYEIRPKDYKQAKQSSIRFVNEFLQKHTMHEAQNIIDSHSKKDDLCDCLLQALAFLA